MCSHYSPSGGGVKTTSHNGRRCLSACVRLSAPANQTTPEIDETKFDAALRQAPHPRPVSSPPPPTCPTYDPVGAPGTTR